MAKKQTDKDILACGQRVLCDEADALSKLSKGLDGHFVAVVQAIRKCKGQVIITGLGKSGLVARKIAATLTSTGTPAVFVHPVEALHGDMGITTSKDMLLALSKSGHSDETTKFVQHFKRLGGLAIAVTENGRSAMAGVCDMLLPLPKVTEADPHELAPTTSTTMMMALGDAVAVTLLSMRGFKAEDFAKYHPDGMLGRRLLLRARDVMHSGEKLPKLPLSATMQDVFSEMTSKGLGVTCVVDSEGAFVGTITDGDLRRTFERTKNPLKLTAQKVLDQSRRNRGPAGPFTITPDTLAIECRQIMNENKIKDLVVLDDGNCPVGVVHIYEITAAGL